MASLNLKIVFISLLLFLTNYSFGQGCSDAGFCTINSFKPTSVDSIKQPRNQVKFGSSYGNADNSITVFGNYLEYNRQLNRKFGIDFKLTSIAQKGNDLSVFGIADAFLNANFRVNERIKLTLGTKIPFSKANKEHKNLALPMDYQASLGTFDLIFGIGYEIKKLQIIAALQQPLTQNDNQFIANNYPINSKLREFQSTNNFKRSGDVLLRVSYPVSLNKSLTFTPSILPIYHLTNDKYTDELNIKREIIGSRGLTLNGNVYLDYEINNKNIIQLNMGVPFVVRDVRPDGLTRSFIATLE